MENAILVALADKWERDAVIPDVRNGSKEAELGNAREDGYRTCKKECADTLLKLIIIIG